MTLDSAYQAQRQRLSTTVARRVAAIYSLTDRQTAVAQAVPLVEAGQRQTVALLDAYMAAKALDAVGAGTVVGLDPSAFVIGQLRNGVTAVDVYARPFTVVDAQLERGVDERAAVVAGQQAAEKLARTDLQLAQTHAARAWLEQAGTAPVTQDGLRVVGYRRVLTGQGPHCALCTVASTRTYKTGTLMAIHEHCGCTVEPLWGTEPVAAVATTVRVEEDPELGPRLLADSWASVGPRIDVA